MKGGTRCPNGVVWVVRSLKVTGNSTNRWSTYKLILSYLAPFLRYSEILEENRRLNIAHLYLAPPLGVTLLEFRLDFWHKNRVLELSYEIVCVILHLAVLVQYRRVTDGQTDVQTNGRTHNDNIYRVSIASHGKI